MASDKRFKLGEATSACLNKYCWTKIASKHWLFSDTGPLTEQKPYVLPLGVSISMHYFLVMRLFNGAEKWLIF
jgi:hypothetical protein